MSNIRIVSVGFLLLLGGLQSGCRNECQQLCAEMAELFDTCGIEYDSSELGQCYDDQKDATDEQLGVCSESLGQVEETLTDKSGTEDACDEVQEYGAL